MSMNKKIVANKIIYPNSMNREDLSKMSKDPLINMLLGKQTASAKKQDRLNRLRAPIRQDQSLIQNRLHSWPPKKWNYQ